MGGRTQMPDDKMRDHNLNQQAGQKDDKGQGQQSPGRNPQDDKSTGQRSGSAKKPVTSWVFPAENNLRGTTSISKFIRKTVHYSLLLFGNWKKEKTNFSSNIELCRRLVIFDGFIRAAKWIWLMEPDSFAEPSSTSPN